MAGGIVGGDAGSDIAKAGNLVSGVSKVGATGDIGAALGAAG